MKQIIILILFLSFSMFSMAEKKEESTIYSSFGIKFGLNLSSFSPAGFDDYTLSYQLGLSEQIQLSQYDYLLVELLFSNENDGYYNLLLPVLYKRDLNHWISLELGPQASVNLGQSRKNNLFGFVFTPDKSLSLGLCAGLSAYMNDKDYFNLRYAKGVTPVYTDPNSYSGVFSLTFVKMF